MSRHAWIGRRLGLPARALLGAALVAVLGAAPLCAATDGADISPDKLVPGADLVIPLPELGPSQHTFKDNKPEPVAMEVILPDNYSRTRPMPVVCVYNGDGSAGNAPPTLALWAKMLEHRNRIIVTVGYEAVDWGSNDANFAHMMKALEVLGRLTAIDRGDLTLAGDKGGAYLITNEAANDRAFTRFLCICGGNPAKIDARALGGRPLMIVAGGDDTDADANDEPPRNEKEMLLADSLRDGGADVTLVVIKGMKHEFNNGAFAPVRAWLGRTATNPDLRHAWFVDQELESANLDSRRAWLMKTLAASWVDLANSADAKAGSATGAAPADAKSPKKP
jgi:acetyl esterase/lipase